MFRAIFYLFITIILISVVRSVVSIIMRGISDAVKSPPPDANGAGVRGPAPGSVPLSGELRKDPVCGTYTAVASSTKQTIRGETFYFCSPQCRDKYLAAAR